MNRLSKFISKDEFVCKCCGQMPPGFSLEFDGTKELFESFDKLREAWGRPLIISSGYRCIKHNKKIGGAPLSVHMFGLALDIRFEKVEEVNLFIELVNRLAPDLRVGTYEDRPLIVHIDTAYHIVPKAHPAWKRGKRFKQ